MNYGRLGRLGLSGIAALGITLGLLMAGPFMEKRVSAPSDLQFDPVRIMPPIVPPKKDSERPSPPEPETAPTLKQPQKNLSKPVAPPVATPEIQAFAASELPPISMPRIPKPEVQPPPSHRAALTRAVAPKTVGAGSIFDMAQVDQMPRVIRYYPPVYPLEARGRRIQGKVVLRCVVSAAGQVEEAKVRSAEPEGIFEKDALKAVRKWRFAPAKSHGKAVSVYVDIPLVFSLD